MKRKSLIYQITVRIMVLMVIIGAVITTLIYKFVDTELRKNQEHEVKNVIQLMTQAVETTQTETEMIEHSVEKMLLQASKNIARSLKGKEPEEIRVEDLNTLKHNWGLHDISLLIPKGDDIVIFQSTDPYEIGVGTKDWDYWYTAFVQLLKGQKVSVEKGYAEDHYWVGPVSKSDVHPDLYFKYAYYYDGSTPFIINPYIAESDVYHLTIQSGPNQLIKKMIQNNDELKEISVMNIEPWLKGTQNSIIEPQWDSPILYGRYSYKLASDRQMLEETQQLRQTKRTKFMEDGKPFEKFFVPLEHNRVMMVTVSLERIEKLQSRVLTIMILSFLLAFFIITLMVRYVVRHQFQPLQKIVRHIRQVASGDFSGRLKLQDKNELGWLAEQVNRMTIKLEESREQITNAEQLIRKSDRLSAVGQLAAGVAHEIRNPLTTIKGFLQFSSKEIDQKYLQIMMSELNRIEFIVGEFLVLSKPQAIQFEPRKVESLLLNIVAFIETEAVMKNVQIAVNYPPELPFVRCEENQLKQVFLNIFKNAIEAMPGGGNIQVTVTMKDDLYLSIQIRDEGQGIEPERLKKIGEPFYTTKEKGTGLGLMVSFKIIEAHQGKVHIESEIGKGTTFEILLPVLKE